MGWGSALLKGAAAMADAAANVAGKGVALTETVILPKAAEIGGKIAESAKANGEKFKESYDAAKAERLARDAAAKDVAAAKAAAQAGEDAVPVEPVASASVDGSVIPSLEKLGSKLREQGANMLEKAKDGYKKGVAEYEAKHPRP